MKEIVILRLSSLGDLVHCLPVYHSLIKAYPKANLHWIVACEFAPLIENLPRVQLHLADKTNLVSLIQSVRKIKKKLPQKIDLFLNLHDSMSANIASLFLPKPKEKQSNLGLAKNQARDFQYLFVARSAKNPKKNQHAVNQYLNCITTLAIDPIYDFNLYLPKVQKDEGKKIIVFNLSTSGKHLQKALSKKLYLFIFETLLEKIALQNQKVELVLTGTKESQSQKIAEAIEKCNSEKYNNQTIKLTNALSELSLKNWLNLLNQSSLIISPDSAAVHLASSLSIDCLSIYLATNPKKIGPFHNQKYCLNVYKKARKKCLNTNEPWDKRIYGQDLEKYIDKIALKELIVKVASELN